MKYAVVLSVYENRYLNPKVDYQVLYKDLTIELAKEHCDKMSQNLRGRGTAGLPKGRVVCLVHLQTPSKVKELGLDSAVPTEPFDQPRPAEDERSPYTVRVTTSDKVTLFTYDKDDVKAFTAWKKFWSGKNPPSFKIEMFQGDHCIFLVEPKAVEPKEFEAIG